MDNKNIVSEVIYYISNYEKSRVVSTLNWNRKFIASLLDSLDVLLKLTYILKGNKKEKAICSIDEYLVKQEGIIFQNSNEILLEKRMDLSQAINLNIYEREVVDLMISIINDCCETIVEKRKNYKKIVANLMRALHNLPRALLNKKTNSILYISPETALEYSYYYLK